MTIEQLDINGNLLDSEPVALGAIEFQDAAEATPNGYTFATHVAIDPAAVTFTLTLDGDVVATRQLTGQPTVTLTSPTAGVSIPRGAPLTVNWTMNDPDGDPLTADLLISDDDGATWRPLAAGVTDQTVTMPVPQDVGGNAVRVKVVVSDGLQMAESTSGAFSAEPETSVGEEQIVFTRADQLGYAGGSQVLTMRPDGSGVQQLALPDQSVYPDLGNGDTACTRGYADCSVVYRDPTLAADGRAYFSSNLLLADLDGPDWPYWDPGFRL